MTRGDAGGGHVSLLCGWGCCRDARLPGESEARLPLEQTPLGFSPGPYTRPAAAVSRPEPSLALGKTLQALAEGAAPAAAGGAGSHPCLGQPRGDRPNGTLPWPCPPAPGPRARGRARCCQPAALRGDGPLGDMGTGRGSPGLRPPVVNTSACACACLRAERGLLPAPLCEPQGGEGGLTPAACGGSLPPSRASVSPQQRGWPGSGQECWGCTGTPSSALPGRSLPPAGICHGLGAPQRHFVF